MVSPLTDIHLPPRHGFMAISNGWRANSLLVPVSAPQVLLDSGVGGAGVDEGQARMGCTKRFVVFPDSHR
jgi:hypothetical protein